MEVINLAEHDFELGPIRPPSEAFSLLIRVSRNCPWNRCIFCTVYKGKKFELRPVEDVIGDIEKAKKIADWIKGLAWQAGKPEQVREIAGAVYQQYAHIDAVRDVALWMFAGAKSVFLQDANSLIMKTPDLARIVSFLKQTFPDIDRITSYARSKTAAKKTVEELKTLNEAGLTRLHIGMESGSDKVLELIQKGVTAAEHIKGGKNVMESGIELSEYIIPGMGGRELSEDHVEGSAMVLNAVNPHFIRLRSLNMFPGIPLEEKIKNGEFVLQSEDEVVMEIRSLIEKLEVTSQLKSDHRWKVP
ncbi:MAG: radical SAM protein [Dehalococcoidia bacterium]